MRIRQRYPLYTLLSGVVCFGSGFGCVVGGSIERWQAEVEQYVTSEGSGDPVVLADLGRMRSAGSLRPARNVIGSSSGSPLFSGRGEEVQGLLLGMHDDWYVFAVGIVDKSNRVLRARDRNAIVEDIRAVGFRGNAAGYEWIVGPPNPDGVAQYQRTYADRGGFASASRLSPAMFPHAFDDFRMTVTGRDVMVEESGSGATWSLPLPDGTGAPSKSEPDQSMNSDSRLIVAQ